MEDTADRPVFPATQDSIVPLFNAVLLGHDLRATSIRCRSACILDDIVIYCVNAVRRIRQLIPTGKYPSASSYRSYNPSVVTMNLYARL